MERTIPNIAASLGDLNPRLLHGSLGPPDVAHQTDLDRFSRFYRAHERNQQTDTQTDWRPRYSVCSNRPLLLMGSGLIILTIIQFIWFVQCRGKCKQYHENKHNKRLFILFTYLFAWQWEKRKKIYMKKNIKLTVITTATMSTIQNWS